MDNNKKEKVEKHVFTSYQKFVIAILAILQFTVILDFMVLSPLGAILLPALHIIPAQFGLVVSAYAFSAGISGIFAAGFADKFDRKKLLLFFYAGFLIGTVLCALAPTYPLLLIARIVTGIFGGVISSVSFAIITDLFVLEVRGRVMGFVQMAFAVSQVLGIPIGLMLANKWSWHAPFWMIAGFGLIIGFVILKYLRPVDGHLRLGAKQNPFAHLLKTVRNSDYLKTFLATTLLATGGFMLMPLGSAFSTNNMHLTMADLPLLYGVTGVFSMIFGPLIGAFSDKLGKFRLFVAGSLLSMVMVLIYTELGPTPLWLAIVINVILFVGITSRMITSSALITAIPAPQDRGAFMSINSSVQQISGGIAAAIAGMIVIQAPDGMLLHYDWLGYVVVCTMLITVFLIGRLNSLIVKRKKTNSATPVPATI